MPLDPVPDDDEWLDDFLEHYGLESIDEWPLFTPEEVEHPEAIRGDRSPELVDILHKFGAIGVLGFSQVIEYDDGTYGIAVYDSV